VDKFCFFHISSFFFKEKTKFVLVVEVQSNASVPVSNKRTLPLCRLDELKHVVGLTKLPPKTLSTMSGTPAQHVYNLCVRGGPGGLGFEKTNGRWRDTVAERMTDTDLLQLC
jgi:hypothetical protein